MKGEVERKWERERKNVFNESEKIAIKRTNVFFDSVKGRESK